MIELKNISFTYENSRDGESQLRHVDLQVAQGELVILAGRSGCGKTTLTRVLNGLCPQFYPGELTGSYLLDGQDALKMPVHQLGTMVGSVFQDPRSQFFTANTTDEIVLGMENIPLERPVMQQRVKAVCSQMNIERLLDRRIFPLSSGEKQLIAIASVCAMEPKVIVMDEPSANLDRDSMVRLGALLYRLKEAGHTILLSEHRFHYVRDSFDRLVFMENGEISAIYSRSEALNLTEAQAPLPAAIFPSRWGVSLKAGGYFAGFENFLYAGRAADFRGRHLFGAKRQDSRHRRAQWRREIYPVPDDHRLIPFHGNGSN